MQSCIFYNLQAQDVRVSEDRFFFFQSNHTSPYKLALTETREGRRLFSASRTAPYHSLPSCHLKFSNLILRLEYWLLTYLCFNFHFFLYLVQGQGQSCPRCHHDAITSHDARTNFLGLSSLCCGILKKWVWFFLKKKMCSGFDCEGGRGGSYSVDCDEAQRKEGGVSLALLAAVATTFLCIFHFMLTDDASHEFHSGHVHGRTRISCESDRQP